MKDFTPEEIEDLIARKALRGPKIKALLRLLAANGAWISEPKLMCETKIRTRESLQVQIHKLKTITGFEIIKQTSYKIVRRRRK